MYYATNFPKYWTHKLFFFLASSTKRNFFENFDKKMFEACIDWTHDSEMYKKNI